ncbi:hypothetical protein GGU11DRAFT_748938 [Lentinula aff. detonsa]|uniref:CFEM domain-containing protein n=1 Tax=Lentinula aff. detonsa TaxID=2804958 RepID=A0AA38KEB3_9AGAR|nr:hypothetical protein GGU10DRAFT_378561 [Lentinula aff. detonsa]KAJ3793408.1 hypothetical protein GGU11DRAFT_748938 [Lentinula aff. detonsa]
MSVCVLSLVAAQSSSSTTSSSSGVGSSSTLGSASSGSAIASTTSSGSGSGSSFSASSTSSAALPSLSGYDTCVVTCFETAIAQVNCSNVVPESCYCNSTDYQNALVSCMRSNCPSELVTAEGLTNKFCALASTSTSISFSITSLPSSSSTSSAAPSAGSTSASGTSSLSSTSLSSSVSSTGSSNAALGVIVGGGLSQAAVPSIVAAAIGVVAGAFLVG